ncbi:MAG TPA: MFS transporter [Cyclobacteriaceae bacterium]|nr:MFS transporter [Cyclobacteriaceae bacterium]
MLSQANKVRALYFLVFSCTASWLPIFADHLNAQGLSGIEISLVLSSTPVMMLLIQPWYGVLADKIGIRKCLIASTLFAAISFLLFLFNGKFFFLIGATVAMSVFYNALQPLLDSVTLGLVQEQPNLNYGSLRLAGAAGWAVTGIIVGYLITSINTNVIFVASSLSLLLAFFISLSLNDFRVETKSAQPEKQNLKVVLQNKMLVYLLAAVLLVSIGATTIWNFYSIYMKEIGASATVVGYGLSFQGLCELPLFFFSAMIIQRLGVKTTLIVTLLATTLRLFLYSWVNEPHWAIAIELLHGISWSLFWVVCVESVNGLVPQQWRATGQSVLYAVYFGAGQIVGNFWTGWLYDQQISIGRIFMLNGFLVLVVAILCSVFIRFQPKTIS